MKVESLSGVVHNAELYDTRYLDNIAHTSCGKDLFLKTHPIISGTAKETRRKVTCKLCLRK